MSRRTIQVGVAAAAIVIAIGAIAAYVRPAYSSADTGVAPTRSLKQGVLRDQVANVLRVVPPVFRVDTYSVRATDGSLVRFDSLVPTADSTIYPSLQRGGFLRNEVERYNLRQRRLAFAGTTRRADWLDSARRVPGGLLTTRGDTARRVVLSPPMSLTHDTPRLPVSVTFRGSRLVGSFVDAVGYRVSLFDSGGSGEAVAATGCRFDPAENRSLRLRCESRDGDGGVVLQVFANDTMPNAGFSFTVERGIVALNGARVAKKGKVGVGDLVAVGSRHFLYTVVHSAPIVPAQIVNGDSRVSPPIDSALGFLVPLSYARLTEDDAPVATTLDPARTQLLQSALEAAVAEGNGDAEYALIIQADVRTGEIRAIAQSGDMTTAAGRYRMLEPTNGGSSTKPLLFMAILSQNPASLSFRTRDDGSGVAALLGTSVPFEAGEAWCPDGLIGLVAAIACSSNAFAVAMVAKGFPVLAKGLDGLFSVVLMEAKVDRPRSGLELWGVESAEQVPSVLEPSSSRLMVRRAVGTRKPDARDLVSLSLGARAGLFTPMDIAQGYVRLVSGRETSVRLVGRGEPGAAWPFAGAKFHEAVLEGMEQVITIGTGRHLFEGGVRPRASVILGKTGHLNEPEARTGTIVLAAGEPVSAGSRRLACGVVTVTHVVMRRGVKASLDPVAERAVSRLSRLDALSYGC